MHKTLKLDNLFDFLVTSYDVSFYKDMISAAIGDIYKTQLLDEKFMNAHFDSVLLSILDKDNLVESLKDLSNILETIKRVDLVLAEMPDHDFLLVLKQKIGQLFANNHIYFDITIDREIFGGFKLIYDGRYYDQSLIALVNKQILSSKDIK